MSSPAAPTEHGRFPYSAIVDRPKLTWPNGARVAVWVIPNIEHFLFDRPSASISQATIGLKPDILNYGWRDYGSRVGVWRMMDIIERRGFKGTVALNADVCTQFPRIIEGIKQLGWEIMGHGPNNSMLINQQAEAEERAIIEATLSLIERSAGKRPRGWLGPALCETVNTPDLLAAAGVDYLADWTNDDQPYPMKVKSGRLYTIPYSLESNDYTFFLNLNQSAEDFGRLLQDQFDVLYEDGKQTGRVMAICLHPFLIGYPHRAKYLDQALAHIASRNEVWMATGSEIIDWYKKSIGM